MPSLDLCSIKVLCGMASFSLENVLTFCLGLGVCTHAGRIYCIGTAGYLYDETFGSIPITDSWHASICYLYTFACPAAQRRNLNQAGPILQVVNNEAPVTPLTRNTSTDNIQYEHEGRIIR